MPAQAAFVEVTNDIVQDTRWTRDNVYILRDVIYVLPPAILTIEPGTIVRGIEDTYCEGGTIGDQPGALFMTRGAKLNANGTPDAPIIFTSIDDPYVPGGSGDDSDEPCGGWERGCLDPCCERVCASEAEDGGGVTERGWCGGQHLCDFRSLGWCGAAGSDADWL
jgi:hypothetical protein